MYQLLLASAVLVVVAFFVFGSERIKRVPGELAPVWRGQKGAMEAALIAIDKCVVKVGATLYLKNDIQVNAHPDYIDMRPSNASRFLEDQVQKRVDEGRYVLNSGTLTIEVVEDTTVPVGEIIVNAEVAGSTQFIRPTAAASANKAVSLALAPSSPVFPRIELSPGLRLCVGSSGLHNGVVIDEPWVSSRHAEVHLGNDGICVVKDTGSLNGVFVNDQRLHDGEWATIQPGQKLSLTGLASGKPFWTLVADTATVRS